MHEPRRKTKVGIDLSVTYLYIFPLFSHLTAVRKAESNLHLVEKSPIIKGGNFEAGFGEKVAFSWPSVDRFGKFFWGLYVKLKLCQISADLVNKELRNATFEGKKHQTQTHRSHASQ